MAHHSSGIHRYLVLDDRRGRRRLAAINMGATLRRGRHHAKRFELALNFFEPTSKRNNLKESNLPVLAVKKVVAVSPDLKLRRA